MGMIKDKMVVHFKNTPYIYDICVDRNDFLEKGSLPKKTKQKMKTGELRLNYMPN